MKNKIKKFFSIEQDSYNFDIYDLTALFTVLNVILIIAGFPLCFCIWACELFYLSSYGNPQSCILKYLCNTNCIDSIKYFLFNVRRF